MSTEEETIATPPSFTAEELARPATAIEVPREPETLEQQVDRLAHVVMNEIPGEPSQPEGAIDTAIRLLRAGPKRFRRHVGAESMIGQSITCLEDGYIKLVDYMGSDEAIDDAARVSYTGGAEEERTLEQRTALIRYLMRHRHTTPFEMVELHFEVALPIMVWRQWIRHRMASVNEFSGRYAELPDLYYAPTVERLRAQSSSNKQGSSDDVLDDAEEQRNSIVTEQAIAREAYEMRLGCGMAKEIARINTPVSQFTVMRWKIDLHNLFHFLALRSDPHAQEEIRVYAEAIADIVFKVVPIAYQAFLDYRVNAVSFSALDLVALKGLIHSYDVDLDHIGMSKREQDELVAKLRRHLGLDLKIV